MLELVRVTETAALRAGRCMGMGNLNLVDEAAVDGMRGMLSLVNIKGTIVIGEGEKDHAPMLYNGEVVGTGNDKRELDIAVDPVEGTRLVANGLPNAISVIVIASRGSLMPVPTFYMQKLAVGPAAKEYIDINAPVRENLRVVAAALGRRVKDLTVVILDRPRHAELIREVREAGARIKLITDGDVAGAISTALPDTGVDLLMGIGGAPEAVITAAAMKCLGGELQAKLSVRNEEDAARATEAGFDDFDRVYSSEDLARGDSLIFAATGITDGDMLQGVRFYGPKATTESIVMRMLTGTVRRIRTTHDLSRKTLRSFKAGQEMSL
ncbi:MAG: class II fructose-bisphosphatase [Firmicutes bacterium]|nr:class II fructose-bisphosphatase [Bacillota bacterium]MDD4337758.1 class II fructose-bisphosphatase [Bacillota bacterium]